MPYIEDPITGDIHYVHPRYMQKRSHTPNPRRKPHRVVEPIDVEVDEWEDDEPVQEKNVSSINYSALPVVVYDNVRLVGVSFLEQDGQPKIHGKVYHYKTTIDDLNEGDLVVVFVGLKPKVVMVTDVKETEPADDIQYKWIAARVDTEAYHHNLDMERQLKHAVQTKKRSVQRQQILDALGIGSGAEEVKQLEFK